jgi:hypothetical protein
VQSPGRRGAWYTGTDISFDESPPPPSLQPFLAQVRLLLVCGEPRISPPSPGLAEKQWLEGRRTVLIYGGSLSSAPDTGRLTALRKLRLQPSAGRHRAGAG